MQKVIDMHCHMFNLKYLPVAGILIRHGKGLVTPGFAKGIEWFLLKNTRESFPHRYSQKSISKPLSISDNPVYLMLNEDKFDYDISDVPNFTLDMSIKAIEQMATVDDLSKGPLRDALDEFEQAHPNEKMSLKRTEFLTEEDETRFRKGVLKRMLEWLAEKVTSIANYLKWFVFMTSSEEEIYTHITEKDEKSVERFLHLMMDVDHFFNKTTSELKYKSTFDFEKQQIDNMWQLKRNHENLIGFVAFNPARTNCMEIIIEAIESKGFTGVKFYPPMGYKSDGDEVYAAQIDKLMMYCCDNNVPLFTHCNNKGFEALPDKNSGYCSSPVFWEKTLEKYPSLTLCLGHAGGNQGWFSNNKKSDKLKAENIQSADIKDESHFQEKDWNKSYASLVFKLCVQYDNVYCDASYLDEMMDSHGGFVNPAKDNFKKRILKLFTSEKTFSQKIMYGSDWHMLFQEGKNGVYLKAYLALFDENELKPYADDFFYNNAVRFLNLKIS